jgi:hypothetical protein
MLNDRVDCWEIRLRPDGSFGVYDEHGLVDGPFGHREDAMAAALRLPRADLGHSIRFGTVRVALTALSGR